MSGIFGGIGPGWSFSDQLLGMNPNQLRQMGYHGIGQIGSRDDQRGTDPVRQAVDAEVANRTMWLAKRVSELELENQKLRCVINEAMRVSLGEKVEP